jgi:hypothetical protein
MGTLDASRKLTDDGATLLGILVVALRSQSEILEALARRIEGSNSGDFILHRGQRAGSILDFAETNGTNSWQDSMDHP